MKKAALGILCASMLLGGCSGVVVYRDPGDVLADLRKSHERNRNADPERYIRVVSPGIEDHERWKDIERRQWLSTVNGGKNIVRVYTIKDGKIFLDFGLTTFTDEIVIPTDKRSFDEKSRLCVRAILGPAAADHPKGSPNTVCTAPGATERYFDAGRGKTVEDAYVIVLHW